MVNEFPPEIMINNQSPGEGLPVTFLRLAGTHARMHACVHALKMQVEVGLIPALHCSHSVRTSLLF